MRKIGKVVRVANWLSTNSIAQVCSIANICFARIARLSIVLQTAPDTLLRDYPLRTVISPFFEHWLIEDIGLTSNDLVAAPANRGKDQGHHVSIRRGSQSTALRSCFQTG